jgi:hypothetical protein
VFTARYALSPYIKQIRFIFKGLMPLALGTAVYVGMQNAHKPFLWQTSLLWRPLYRWEDNIKIDVKRI